MSRFGYAARLQREVCSPPTAGDCQLRSIHRTGIAGTVFAVLLGVMIGQLADLAIEDRLDRGETVEVARLRSALATAQRRAEEAGQQAVNVVHDCERIVGQLCTCPEREGAWSSRQPASMSVAPRYEDMK